MVKNLMEIKKNIKTDDEYDAIAVGLTFLASEKMLGHID
jgi:Holliday junction resolvasome RuvABC endonuclease subunit